jgi:hypothetical protein
MRTGQVFDWLGFGEGLGTALEGVQIDVVAANSMVSAMNSPQVQKRLNREYFKLGAVVLAAVASGIVLGTTIARRSG